MTTPGQPPRLETVGERYVLVEQVAATDDREVWLAHDDLANRQVVVTRYLTATDEWRRSFDQRARALEAVRDPGIASVLRHDAQDQPPWLAAVWVDGETVATIGASAGFTADDALAVVGQAALALATAHGAGIGHGSVDADHVVVRTDGSVALIDFAVATSPSPSGDVRALANLARGLITSDDADVARFVEWMEKDEAGDPTEVGRTALALASAQRAGVATTSLTPAEPSPAAEPRRPWYDEEEKKRVRNRLIALGTIVVVGGAALLWFVSRGSGQTTVPSVIGLSYAQAQQELNQVGLRTTESATTGSFQSLGQVTDENPPAGARVKVGTLIELTVVTGEIQ